MTTSLVFVSDPRLVTFLCTLSGFNVHFDVKDAAPGDNEVVGFVAAAGLVRVGDGAYVLVGEGEVTLYPGDALFVARGRAGLGAWAACCLVVDFSCCHVLPPLLG